MCDAVTVTKCVADVDSNTVAVSIAFTVAVSIAFTDAGVHA